jgi:NAD(P)-dependent dehydrogenase (short-subunit alcohol dehydrogenase family)
MELGSGTVALVTGAAGGIGSAVVDRLRSGGVTVVGTDLAGLGADLELDVTDREACRAVVASLVAEHGRLDVLVACAGIAVGGPAEDIEDQLWDRCLAVNLAGTVHIVRAAYAAMLAQGAGHLVAIASLAGLGPAPLLTPYAASKGGVVSLMTSLRPEASHHGIGVTVVCPGPVDTVMLDGGGAHGHVGAGVDARRYLTDVAGKPISPQAVADAIWIGIRKDQAVVTPGRARVMHLVGRLLPRLVDKESAKAMAKELSRTAR